MLSPTLKVSLITYWKLVNLIFSSLTYKKSYPISLIFPKLTLKGSPVWLEPVPIPQTHVHYHPDALKPSKSATVFS